MNVIVTYTREADLQLAHRVRSLPGELAMAEEVAIGYLEEIKNRLILARGHLPESILQGGTDPPHYRIPFINDIWIEYIIEDRPLWFWRTERTITLVGFPVVRV
jgi:hypothetical protein